MCDGLAPLRRGFYLRVVQHEPAATRRATVSKKWPRRSVAATPLSESAGATPFGNL